MARLCCNSDESVTAAYRHGVLSLNRMPGYAVHGRMPVVITNTHPLIISAESDTKRQGVTAIINRHHFCTALRFKSDALAMLVATCHVLPIETNCHTNNPPPRLRALLRLVEREILRLQYLNSTAGIAQVD